MKWRKSMPLTPRAMLLALDGLTWGTEIRVEFSGDDNTPQELVMVERRESEGKQYVCFVIRNS